MKIPALNSLRPFLLVLCLIFVAACAPLRDVQIQSPNERVLLHFHLTPEGAPTYSVTLGKKHIITRSPLGFEFKDAPPIKDKLSLELVRESKVSEPWQPVWGEQKIVDNTYNKLELVLREEEGMERRMGLEFRVYNDGVGFRYTLDAQEDWDSVFITNELTGFQVSENATAWWIPADFDSYEHLYTESALADIEAVNTPFTCRMADGTHFSIHEAALLNYAGMTLKADPNRDNFFEAELVPWPDSVKVRAKLPLNTPWRTIQLAREASGLLESNLIANLNEPCQIENTDWIQPMKYIGVWWGLHIGTQTWVQGPRHGASTETLKNYIDFAAEHHIGGVLAEGWNTGWEYWGRENAFDYVTPTADLDLNVIAEYARSKGVAFIMHHETGGDAADYARRLDTAFGLAQSLGVHAIKTGYAGAIRPIGNRHHGQWMVNHYQQVVETAARYQIALDVHEPIKPTGLERTWPNLMTGEGVRGMEWNAWSAGNPPEHTTILPFTRGLAGPIDYTPGIFDLLLNESPGRIPPWAIRDGAVPRVHTTLAKQLALYVVLYSPWQMAADLPENYRNQAAFKFISDVPTNWEESKVLEAEIGDLVIMARKKGQDWFLGAIGDEEKRHSEFRLEFLDRDKTYKAEVYRDGDQADWRNNPLDLKVEDMEVKATDYLRVNLAPGGGMAVRFSPAE